MKKRNGFLSLRFAVALGVVLICILWAAGQYAGGDDSMVSGPEDLRVELLWAQSLTDSGDAAPKVFDAGSFVFVPGGDPVAELFADGLVPVMGNCGETVWPVTLFEDLLTREAVFVNAAGEEIGRLPPLDGYAPTDIVMTALLLPPGSALAATGIRHAGAPVAGKAAGMSVPSDAGLAGVGEKDQHEIDLPCASAAVADADGARLPEPVLGSSSHALFEVNSTLYADSDSGNGLHDGYSRFVEANGVGPKATVQQAINAAVSGDTVEMRGASAFTDRTLNLGGKSIVLRPVGHVRF